MKKDKAEQEGVNGSVKSAEKEQTTGLEEENGATAGAKADAKAGTKADAKAGVKTDSKADTGMGTDVKEGSISEIETVKTQLGERTRQCDDYLNALQRTTAEFDNYKKRTAKEKEALGADTTGEVIAAFLPVVDNIERALKASDGRDDIQAVKEGIELVYRQLKDIMAGFGLEVIKCKGEKFDPRLHNAVMHVTDDAFGENIIVEELQKGYIINDRIIRHSMVKVAN